MTTVFKPTPKHQYQISFFNCQINTYDEIDRYDAYQHQQNIKYYQDTTSDKSKGVVINQSPTFSESTNAIPIAKTPTVQMKERKSKKYWTTEQKKLAVEKAKELGLSKATKYLQLYCPQIFSDLSPSTLQYWIHKSKTDSLL